MDDLVKMSSKGQLVVPKEIREGEGFRPSDRFVAVKVHDGVLFKRIALPDVKNRFEALAREVERKFRVSGVREKDVEEAVRWARKRR
jgi:bifunctional DNA-binding transcriptional regulator/antitoxin component of YhaV-PrlF toxin-antitoxin module